MKIEDFKRATVGMPKTRYLCMQIDQNTIQPLTNLETIGAYELALSCNYTATAPLTIEMLVAYSDQTIFYLVTRQGIRQPVFGYRVVDAGLLLR